MLNRKLITLMNEQISKEFYSAYLYLDFANVYEAKGLLGFANWYEVQAREELDHARLIYRYLQSNNAEIKLMTIEAPDVENAEAINGVDIKGEKLLGLLKASLKHEEYITSLIDNIYSVANELKDYRTMQFLDWFVKEQGEEEESLQNLIAKAKLFGNDSCGLYALDAELASRTYTAETLIP